MLCFNNFIRYLIVFFKDYDNYLGIFGIRKLFEYLCLQLVLEELKPFRPQHW